jgi:hypothetical protein
MRGGRDRVEVPILEIDFVLLGSTTRKRIVASAWVMRHRRIPVIQWSAITSRAAPGIDVQPLTVCRSLDDP